MRWQATVYGSEGGEQGMFDNEECFHRSTPGEATNPLKELSDEQLVEKAIDESVEVTPAQGRADTAPAAPGLRSV